ncbi:MAG TPA: toll/interleukin-1 receptor domain-containing protein [Ktedonobacterales bacterium]|nr:toll/interleukin-1 receptor domain-containing protein [Ktedonobacterales bacterium]
MPQNQKVFISYAPEDGDRCEPIIRALKDNGFKCWRAPVTVSTAPIAPGDALSADARRELEQRAVFMRLCTPATQTSSSVQAEAAGFRQLQAAERQHGRSDMRLFVDLILDAAYQPAPGDGADLTINAAGRPVSAWIVALDQRVGKLKATREIDRRMLTALVTVAVLIGFLLLVYAALHVHTFGIARPR